MPEEEVAHAHLAAGADEQVRVGHVLRVEMLRDDLLVDLRGFEFPLLHLGRDGADGLDDLRAPAIAEREREREAAVLGKGLLRLHQLRLHRFGQSVNLPDGVETDVVLVQLPDLILEIAGEVLHQRIDLVLGAVPVLDGEGVEGEILDTRLARRAHDGAHGFRSLPVPLDAREMPLPRPTPISIHDDGHMNGHRGLGGWARVGHGDGSEGRGQRAEGRRKKEECSSFRRRLPAFCLLPSDFYIPHRKIVCSRAGPTDAMTRVAPVNFASPSR